MVRVWRRRLLGGIGIATVAPGLLLASLVVLALAGGFGSLSALGQAFSGPAVPGSAGGGPAASVSRPLPPRLVAALSSTPPAPRARSGGGLAPPASVPAPRRGPL